MIVPPSLREAHRAGFSRYMTTGESHILDRRIEISALRADGSEFPVELTITRTGLPGSGQAGPAVLTEGSGPRPGSAVACHMPIRLEGRARTLSGPSPDLSPAWTLALAVPRHICS
jgi:hypothetical protein